MGVRRGLRGVRARGGGGGGGCSGQAGRLRSMYRRYRSDAVAIVSSLCRLGLRFCGLHYTHIRIIPNVHILMELLAIQRRTWNILQSFLVLLLTRIGYRAVTHLPRGCITYYYSSLLIIIVIGFSTSTRGAKEQPTISTHKTSEGGPSPYEYGVRDTKEAFVVDHCVTATLQPSHSKRPSLGPVRTRYYSVPYF